MIKKIKILTIALLFSTAAQAQVFIMEDDNSLRPDGEEVLSWPLNPQSHNEGIDSYTPLGSGVFLLTALGAAYLFKKKKKE